jgi:hypothetical protein
MRLPGSHARAKSASVSFDDITPLEQVVEPGSAHGARIPWWAKIGAKVVLSRALPGYRLRKKLGLFLHGNLDRNIERHATFVNNVLAQHARYDARPASALVELGPGNSLATALFAAAHGLSRTWLVDVGDFASDDMALYRKAAGLIEGPAADTHFDFADRATMLASVNATYLTNGVASLAEIPSGSVDVILSTSVLEHVGRSEFRTLMSELFRVLTASGTAYHEVDLMDHLGGEQNHYRIAESAWEHPLLANSGFYTNRFTCSEIVAMMRDAGFEAALTRIARWSTPPTPRAAFAEPFRSMPEDELSIASFGVMLRKPG